PRRRSWFWKYAMISTRVAAMAKNQSAISWRISSLAFGSPPRQDQYGVLVSLPTSSITASSTSPRSACAWPSDLESVMLKLTPNLWYAASASKPLPLFRMTTEFREVTPAITDMSRVARTLRSSPRMEEALSRATPRLRYGW